jgi:choline-sulfatase
MNRLLPRTLRALLLTQLIFLGIGLCPCSGGTLNRAPNFVVIIGDDHRADALGVAGSRWASTPHLDQLAREGTRFDRAYCNAPVCTASRQSLLTGLHPHTVGVTLLTTPLPENSVTLSERLRPRGYATAAIGKMHFNSPADHGFQTRIDLPDWRRWFLKQHPETEPYHSWRPMVDPAHEWLNAQARPEPIPDAEMDGTYLAEQACALIRKHQNEPFLLFVGFHEPHSPFRYPNDQDRVFQHDQFPVPVIDAHDREEQPLVFRDLKPREIQGIQAAYHESLRFLDRNIGKLVRAIDDAGLREQTLIIYLGDNGYMLGEHGRFEKHCFYEPAVRVPLIARWPGRIAPGQVRPELVQLLDLAPTFLEYAGMAIPPELQGASLVPLLEAMPGASGREWIFSEYLENEEAMLRDARWKLIAGTGQRHRQDGYATANPLPGPYLRLFDTLADPGENRDLSQEKATEEHRERLLDRLHHIMVTTRPPGSPVPAGLNRDEAIAWCLAPRD